MMPVQHGIGQIGGAVGHDRYWAPLGMREFPMLHAHVFRFGRGDRSPAIPGYVADHGRVNAGPALTAEFGSVTKQLQKFFRAAKAG